jgi:hypothetical protein
MLQLEGLPNLDSSVIVHFSLGTQNSYRGFKIEELFFKLDKDTKLNYYSSSKDSSITSPLFLNAKFRYLFSPSSKKQYSIKNCGRCSKRSWEETNFLTITILSNHVVHSRLELFWISGTEVPDLEDTIYKEQLAAIVVLLEEVSKTNKIFSEVFSFIRL